jgi:hypothetical protein
MTEDCKDPSDLIQSSANSITAQRFVPPSINMNDIDPCKDELDALAPYREATFVPPSNDGLLRRNNIDALISDFERQVVSSNVTALEEIISSFGEEQFKESVTKTNLFFYKAKNPVAPFAPIDFSQYPNLEFRLNQGTSITLVEVAEFTKSNFFTPLSLLQAYRENPSRALRQWDNYYNDNFSKSSLGSFCALAPSIFGAISGFFTLAQGLAEKINDFIGKIKNFSVAGLIDNLKNQIKKVIDKVIENVKSIIENFSVENVMNQVKTFVNESIIARALQIKEEVESFFSEENIRRFKEKVDGLIAYAINLFKDPSLEEIQYLIYRFCSFIEQVESLINGVKAPLDNFANNFDSAYNAVSSAGSINTIRAIQSGALRFDSQTRRVVSDDIQGRTRATGTSNPRPIAQADVEGVTSWNNGRGDSRIRFGPGLQPGRMGEEGWIRVSPTARVYLMRVQERFGRQLEVRSGYRSPEYNASLRPPGARNSKHMDGTALDISWNGFSVETMQQFINIAFEEGFLGIGRYSRSRFVHIDLGPRRSWGS